MQAAPGVAPPKRLDPASARAVLLILSAIALMVQYVETMVIPALVKFEQFFQLGTGGIPTVTWVLTAYLLVGTVATPVFSKLGDIAGKKQMLVLVMSIYAVAVSIAGFTPDLASGVGISRPNAVYLFIAVRGVQGIGLAMFPLAFAMIGEQFPPREVGVAQGIVSAMFAAGAALGLFGGAWITNTYGWQLTYHTVIPFAVLAVILAVLKLPDSPSRLKVRLDIGGALSLGVGLGGVLVALSEGPTWGWTNWGAVSAGSVALGVPDFLVLAIVGFVAFFIWEPRAHAPIVDFARLVQRNVWISNVVGLTTAAGMFIIFVTMTELVQVPPSAYGLGQSVFTSGLLFIPSVLCMLVLGPLIGRAIPRYGPKPFMILGGALVAFGGLLLFFFNRLEVQFLFAPIPALLGMVMAFIAMVNVVVVAAQRQEIGIVTGMNQTFRNVGMALGPAIAASLLTSFTFAWGVPGTFGRVTVPLPTLDAYRYAFLVTACLGLVGLVLSLFLRNYRYLADGTRVEGPAAASPDGRTSVTTLTATPK